MAHEIGDLLRAQRPFPNDAQASYDACEDDFEAEVASFEELTPKKIEAFVMAAAKGHRYLCFRITYENEPPSLETIGERFAYLYSELAKHVTNRMLASMHGGRLAQECATVDTYHVRLYDHNEADVPPERADMLRAILLRHGIEPHVLDGDDKPVLH